VGLERGPLSLVSTMEELLGRKNSGSGLENRDYGRRRSAALTTRHPSIRKKLALTSPTSGDNSFGIVRSRTEATEFVFVCLLFVRANAEGVAAVLSLQQANSFIILSIGLCILLRVYQSIYIYIYQKFEWSYCMSTDPLLQYVNM
jgi:hypothetical protein